MIYLICSTIRPTMFIETHNDWMSKVDNSSNIITKVVVDSIEDRQLLNEYDCLIYDGDTLGITKPLYKLTTSLIDLNDDDIIILLSDDFYPPDHWDTFILEQYDGYTGGLLVCDGTTNLQQNQIVTIPILDYKTLKLMNMVIYHPSYIHMYSDNELYTNLVQLNLLKDCTHRIDKIFKHLHWTIGTRTYDEHDKILHENTIKESVEIYNNRMMMPLSQRLLVDDYNSTLFRGQNIIALVDHVLMYYDQQHQSTQPLQNGDIVYCDVRSLYKFRDILMKYNDLVIITHNCDGSVVDIPPTRSIDVNSNDFIGCFRKWFTVNNSSSNPNIISIPIGFENSKWDITGIKTRTYNLEMDLNEIEPKFDVYLNCGDMNTNLIERSDCYDKVRNIDVVTIDEPHHTFNKYMDIMSQFKFIISPYGNGLDCHRTWEILSLGRIPIIKRGPLNKLYDNLPILFVNDWGDIENIDIDFEYNRLIELFDRRILTQEYWNMKILEGCE